MTPVFADTAYFIALISENDRLHAQAVAAARRYGKRETVTTEMVMTELLNHFSGSGPWYRAIAARFVQEFSVLDSNYIVPQTPELFAEALALYAARSDKEWGLTDCASMCVCRRDKITEVLTYDHHFAQAGFVALLRDE